MTEIQKGGSGGVNLSRFFSSNQQHSNKEMWNTVLGIVQM